MRETDYSKLVLLLTAVICFLMPPVLGQAPYDDLQHAKDSLIAKEQRLQQMHEKTRTEIDRLNAQLETSKQLLDAIDTRLDQTRSAIRKVDDALKGT